MDVWILFAIHARNAKVVQAEHFFSEGILHSVILLDIRKAHR